MKRLLPGRRVSQSAFALSFLLSPLLVVVGSEAAAAQNDPGELITDRPDQTESTETVAPGFVQIELGSTYRREDGDGARIESISVPETLARIGIAERFELRVGWDGLIFAQLEAPGLDLDDEGSGDASLGFKVELRGGAGGGPAIALLAETSLPVGDDGFTSDEYDPSVRLSVAHDLSERLSLGWNVGAALATEDDGRGGETTLATAFYTLALGISLSERTGAFIEVFGDLPISAPGGPANSLDGGFTWLLRPNLQLDAAAGIGLSDAAEDFFAGLGVTVRLPH